jgi:hypothetical protein
VHGKRQPAYSVDTVNLFYTLKTFTIQLVIVQREIYDKAI